MHRKIVIGIGSLIALLVAIVIGGYLWARTSLPQTSGIVTVAGLERPAKIVRDGNAVLHIFAESQEDAYFALGFSHAQDRLWQMEFMRRLGAGRLAEVLGEATLKFDRFFRTLGIYRLAEENYERLSPDVRRAFDSYVDGVNAWVKTRSGALPPEFLVLGFEPEPWRPADSLVVGRIMALRLARNWRTELIRARISRHLKEQAMPPELQDQLWSEPDRPTPSTVEYVRQGALKRNSIAKAIWSSETYGGSSNAWAVHGRLTSTGKPILANDPHLAFGAPIIWYLARIEAPGLTVTGATLPGAPLTVLGHNGDIAWGFTNGYGDAEDLFVETIAADDPAAYLTPTGARKFATRVEVILVKDGEPHRLTVRATGHGPVISDISEAVATLVDERHVIALQSTAFRADDRTIEALFAINRARDWTAFRKAAASFHAPHQNLMFAAVDGDICFISAGRIPVRAAGDGRLPVPGADGARDWQGFIPPEDLPWICNPPSGRIVNANNRVVPKGYAYHLTHDWPPPFRAQRILEGLDRSEPLDADDMAALQNDILSPVARRLLPLMVAFEPRHERTAQARDLLARWDHSMRRDRPEPLIYTAWLRQFIVALIDDELEPDLVDGYLALTSYPGLRLVEVALTGEPRWCDDIGTPEQESCAILLERALRRALDEVGDQLGPDMADWRWGALHRATFAHRILTRVPIVKWFADLSIESDGGDHTINRGITPRARPGNSFRHLDGSGFRAVFDLADLDRSRFMIATGQSGNLLSPHYSDLLERWRDGRYIRIAGRSADLEDNAIGKLMLRPAGQ